MGRGALIMRVVGRAAIACGLGAGLRPPTCEAQISPGPLSRSHAALDGIAHCTRCHEARVGLPASRCLACHTALQARLAAGQGLHARAEYRDCKKCHVEHHGLEHDLVWWGKAGRGAFDHRHAGYALEGGHARIACEACHQVRFQRRSWEAQDGVNAARTYLGLATSCLVCHAELHRGTRLGVRDCADCHTFEAWAPASRFDHRQTPYALTGRHAALPCAKCHAVRAADGVRSGDRKSAGAGECTGCHEDVHRGRLGAACSRCHSTAGWMRVERAGFDHDRTGYPLRGRHMPVACDACHAAGRPLRPRHERCADCHSDSHWGQLADRADRGRCESCHEVSGFAPAKYTFEDHQRTRYLIEGAHLAVACNACHRRVGPQALRAIPGLSVVGVEAGARETPQLRFASTRCAECHRDAHWGELDKYLSAGGCESCHAVEAWRKVSFDHAQTRFALAGGHAKPRCAECHKKTAQGTPRERTQLAGLPLACEPCHQDPHQGQFRRAGAAAGCGDCHDRQDVRASKFDHARDSAYPLDGAHARVACAACHRRVSSGGASFVRYRPLGKACRDCHAPARVPAARKAS